MLPCICKKIGDSSCEGIPAIKIEDWLRQQERQQEVLNMDNEKVFRMGFGKIYDALLNKAIRKGRTKAEVDEVTC